MKILAFDTSSTACSVALLNSTASHSEEITTLHRIAPMQQAQLILPMIEELLASAALTYKQLDAIAYGCGPGSFTGVRIAASVAQGIGFAAQLPIISISSIAALAQTAVLEQKLEPTALLLVALDARMQQVYWGTYQVNAAGQVELVGDEQLCAPDNIKIPEILRTAGQQHKWYGIGDGWEKYLGILTAQISIPPQATHTALSPNASAMLQMAKTKFTQKQWLRPEEALPIYIS